jgi:hypothetical protein
MLAKNQRGRALVLVGATRSDSSRKAHPWISTIALVGAIGCASALLTAVTGAALGVPELRQSGPSSNIPSQTYEGVITDTHCGAKHSAAIGATATDCTIRCVRAGEQFVLVDGETIYLLEGDMGSLKRVAGQRVRIVGTLNGKTISVTAVATT